MVTLRKGKNADANGELGFPNTVIALCPGRICPNEGNGRTQQKQDPPRRFYARKTPEGCCKKIDGWFLDSRSHSGIAVHCPPTIRFVSNCEESFSSGLRTGHTTQYPGRWPSLLC